MESHLRRYMNGLIAAISLLIGVQLTALVLPTTGEAMNTGGVLGSTLLFAAIVGGAIYLLLVRATGETEPAVDGAGR